MAFSLKKTKKKEKTDYVAVFCRNINGIPTYIDEKIIEKDDKDIVYDKKGIDKSLTWVINVLTPTFRDTKGRLLIFCDMDNNGSFLTFNKNEMPISIKSLDAIVTQNIVVGFLKLIKGAFDKKDNGKILIYIVMMIMGGAVGYIIRGSIEPPKLLFLPFLGWV